jgi:hypothetical protein
MVTNREMSSGQFPWRPPTSGEIYCLGLGRVGFYLPLLEIRGKRIEVSLQYQGSPLDKCGSFTLVGLGRIGCEEIV